ncbi:MAG: cofactor assembly of complex C subunit B, partial [Cyanobacteria bacterium J06598_3]
ELAWASHLLLTNTVTRSVIVYYAGKTLLRRGILPPIDRADVAAAGGDQAAAGGDQSADATEAVRPPISPGTIVRRVLDKQSPVYLVNLSIYPGRVEFDYLPVNTQGVICQPLGDRGVLILGANAPRSYTQQDEAWIAGIAEKLSNTLQTQLT